MLLLIAMLSLIYPLLKFRKPMASTPKESALAREKTPKDVLPCYSAILGQILYRIRQPQGKEVFALEILQKHSAYNQTNFDVSRFMKLNFLILKRVL